MLHTTWPYLSCFYITWSGTFQTLLTPTTLCMSSTAVWLSLSWECKNIKNSLRSTSAMLLRHFSSATFSLLARELDFNLCKRQKRSLNKITFIRNIRDWKLTNKFYGFQNKNVTTTLGIKVFNFIQDAKVTRRSFCSHVSKYMNKRFVLNLSLLY